MSFVGWFIFSIYVGIGFIALPMDCINSFRHRPKVRGLVCVQASLLVVSYASGLQLTRYHAFIAPHVSICP